MRLLAGVAAAAALTTGLAGASSVASVPELGRVVVIVFENKEFSSVVGSRSAPVFNRLGRRYARLSEYFGVVHPSLPNYLALVSGSTHGISSDCTKCSVDAPSLADSLDAAGLGWKTYAESLPNAGFTGPSDGLYAKKHNPFLYFRGVVTNPERLRRVVPLTRLENDLAEGTLPDFSLVVPNLCHDMHDCSVATGDAWLGRFLPPLLRSPQLADGVVFVVFDEGQTALGGGGRVPALALGPAVRPGSRTAARLTHYSLLRTIEDAWSLPRLGLSARARPITGIWRTPLVTHGS